MKNSVTRNGVFETNSSSTHSISIASGSDFIIDKLPYNPNGSIVEIHAGEFGWEQEQYYDAATKASYCLTYIMNYAPANRANNIKMLIDVVKNTMMSKSVKEVKFISLGMNRYDNENEENWGYIDHQSDYVCGKAFESPEKLKAFIFNPASMLRTDNDNH